MLAGLARDLTLAVFDALVVDWYLAEGNAREILEAFAAAYSSSPRVVISGLAQDQAGYKGPLADKWLVKPVEIHELVQAIGDLEMQKATRADMSSAVEQVREMLAKKKDR